mmetsp:Transcript_3219/g.9241  ORF Transcript_3219/g.9241 Transcript_3219/m.9241 type:complete len:326 (+) Transcript_3219:1796-2773(+)
MRELVCDNSANSLLLAVAGLERIDEQVDLAISHKAPILHSACCELRNSHHIKLREGVGHTEEIVESVQSLRGTVQGELSRLRFARGGVDLDEHPMLGLRLDVIEFADHKGEKIGGHDGTVEEGQLLLIAAGQGPTSALGHVAKGVEFAGDDESHTKDGLAGWFVPARKGPTGIQGLELRRGHDLGLAMDVGVGRAVESRHLIVEKSAVLDGEVDGGVGGDGGPKNEGDRGGLGVDADLLGIDRRRGGIPVGPNEGSRCKAKLLGVHDDLPVVGTEIGRRRELDLTFSGEREGLEVRGELDVVPDWYNVCGEKYPPRGLIRCACHG